MNALDKQLKPLLKILDENYAKVPALPKGATDFIVGVAPWLALLGGILALFAAYGLYTLISSPYVAMSASFGGVNSITWIISALVLVAVGILYFVAFPALKARKVKGWNLMLYGEILYVLSAVAKLNVVDVVTGLIGALIGYYFLYQVKSYYK
jgi:hypothetical protein